MVVASLSDMIVRKMNTRTGHESRLAVWSFISSTKCSLWVNYAGLPWNLMNRTTARKMGTFNPRELFSFEPLSVKNSVLRKKHFPGADSERRSPKPLIVLVQTHLVKQTSRVPSPRRNRKVRRGRPNILVGLREDHGLESSGGTLPQGAQVPRRAASGSDGHPFGTPLSSLCASRFSRPGRRELDD